MAGIDDYGSNLTGAGLLTVGGQQTGSFEAPGDSDAFWVSLDAGKSYTFSASGANDAAGTAPHIGLTLYGVYNGQTYKLDSSVAGAGSFSATASLGPNAVYYVVAADRDALHGSGGYVIKAGVMADDYQANPGGAGSIAIGAGANGVLNAAGDIDWFKADLKAGQSYTFILDGTQGSLGFDIVDDKGNVVSGGKSLLADGGTMLAYTPASAGSYYVQIKGGTGAYQLQAALSEPDDYSATAKTSAVLPDAGSIKGRLEIAGDHDWIKVHMEAGKAYTFGIAASIDSVDPQLVTGFDLLSGDGATLAFGSSRFDSHDQTLTYRPATTGDYYIQVAGSAGLARNDYTITSYAQPKDAVAGDASTTGLLAAGLKETGKIDSAGDLDWYQLDLKGGETYTFVMAAAGSGGGTLGDAHGVADLWLYTAGGGSVGHGTATDTQGATLVFSPTVNGTYYLQAGSTGLNTGSYTLLVGDSAHAIPDIQPPTFRSMTGATAVDGLADNLRLDFSENLARGDGLIKLKLASGEVVETYSMATSDRISISNGQLTIDPTKNLVAGKDYVIEIGAGSLKDGSDNGYAAATTHTFHTADAALNLQGGAGNDVFHAGTGSDTISGGAGVDTVIYGGARTGYTITQGNSGSLVLNGYAGTLERDALTSVERLQFSDTGLAFDTDGAAGQIFRLYLATFGRQPDEQGMGFWLSFSDKGMTQAQIADFFVSSPEFSQRYGAQPSEDAFIAALYDNVLHRAPDADGLAFWHKALQEGTTRVQALTFFADSPENLAASAELYYAGIHYTPFL
jgi:hypothetical protein